ncbi:amidohydrolase family protein [Alsobacter sp. SYSU M60028]|uniref:Amidohydrolase family protein n=1 Tax=Alsobacter ponti TaxID=2962936 RepID=A0ABT1LAJ9_9HYPH|nr:amidohydrolase family protein [Alsobacter ponti]MCP8938001.1 amidohydrolase family protein [Alsobacter ponti]
MTLRIDAHQHFWHLARGDYGWLTPELKPLFRSFGPEDLGPLLEKAGMQGTVLVQAAPTVAETDYMLGIADSTEFVKGVVGWCDFEAADAVDEIDRLARHPLLKGMRPMIQDIADVDWMLKPELDAAFRALIAHDLAFDALTHPRHLPNLLHLAERYPELRIVVDHGSKPAIRDRAFDDWARDMARIASRTQAYCKLSGLVTEAGPEWTVDDLRPYTDHLLDCFGAGRLIFGSDWPVCTLASSYQRWVDAAETLMQACGAGERIAVFGGNAVGFYRLKV